MEAKQMIKYDNTTFILVKDKEGERFLCPINTRQSLSSNRVELNDDCFEADVVGRYAGNINLKTS